ncbi:DUF5666 domain-containing protein [Pseudoalteromonas sp.]|uniref:DUF5666 domain-containing protein n=2 Tax=Pseudoalteromonas TaxID=53246 RepID=UPI003F94E509
MKNQHTSHLIKILSLSTIALVLSACGSSSSESSSTTPETTTPETATLPNVLIGAVSATSGSSITINQRELPAASAEIEIDGENGSLSQLQVGMMVEAETNGTQVTEIDYDSNFKGPILVENGTASIAGMILEEFDSTSVNNGDLVEVSGFNSAFNTLTVTYQQAITNSLTELEVEGVITQLDTQLRTFQLGNITINYQQAEVDGFISNGQFVEVEGVMQNQQLMASEVDAERQNDFDDNIDTELNGKITFINNNSTLMTISGQWQVSLTEQTRYEDGTVYDLAVGELVDVEALYQQQSDLFIAQEVDFESSSSNPTAINKAFSVAGVASFNEGIVTINNHQFTLNNQTVFDDGLTQATINGQFLELEGIITDDINIVSEIELMDANDSLSLTGYVITQSEQSTLWGYVSEDNSLNAYADQYAELECELVSGNQVRACRLDD